MLKLSDIPEIEEALNSRLDDSPVSDNEGRLFESQSHKRLGYQAEPKEFVIKLNAVPEATEVSLMPAMPILPKSTFEFRLPPRCPLSNITFT